MKKSRHEKEPGAKYCVLKLRVNLMEVGSKMIVSIGQGG